MSNLGAYQRMTIWAKKVGGPNNLLAITLATGAVLYKVSEKIIKRGVEYCKQEKDKKYQLEKDIYIISEAATSDGGVKFEINDRYKILEKDSDSVLIEKIGDKNNPYFVSSKFLKTISNYK